jgi:HK97 family phage major capsid protein
MKTNIKKMPAFDMSDNSEGAPYGGLALAWAAEQSLLNTEMAKLRLVELVANKAYVFSFVSNELIEDGGSFQDSLGTAFAKSIGWGLDRAFFSGSGAGQPLGVLNDPSLIVVPKTSGQTGGTINYTNLSDMFARIHPLCLNNSVWVANSSSIPQLLSLVIPGTTVPVVVQNTVTGEFRILSRPCIFTEKLPTLGTQGDIILADYSQYVIGMRKDVMLSSSNAPGFMQDLMAFRGMVRITGQGSWQKAFTPLNGPTLSWCVTLATRS